ncbi:zinc finger, C3HC4 type (RING finger) family protein [Tasmannia lanceolata]|uniref:zinc finger, C3HC4 type (RING finger) family protein n=1 Tax=Tasmannia lanceolata TaxID=3420 RepID=UPI0040648D89
MDSSRIDPFLLEDFGQRVDLTRRIREVLVNYPEGTTVLKELIQNADDAGATKVCLCLDLRSHGVNSLLSDHLAEWQGPALLAYNNAEFTEDDFVSISRIGDSKKQGQAWKTGRFGVGFNSVYHLTDLPSFVSGKYVVLFDPQGVYLPNVSAANPGKRVEYVSSSAISLYKDQFFPYCAFGCDMKKSFRGTLFRFPLRNTDQAAVSKLSRQSYSEDDISSMFAQLYKEAVFTMLFLKNVLSVEMYIWDADAHGPRKIYSCSVNLPNDETIWHRQAILRLSNLVESPDKEMDSFALDFSSEAVSGTHLEKRIDTFFIVQSMASASSKIGSFATTAAKEYDLHLLPWASVAACISDSLPEVDVLKQGRAFCFLPLPVKTGLTVQVNGYFEVSSNRRSIWFGADMDRGGKLRSDWNRLLLEDVVAPAFNKLLLGVRKLYGPTDSYYSLWPRGSFDEPWNILVGQIYRNMGDTPVLYSDIGGGNWVSPDEAFLHDEEFTKSKELEEALVMLRMPIVHLPKPLVDMIFKYASRFQQRVVSPFTVRHYLRECENLNTSSRILKIVLLEYCLLDLVDADVRRHANGLPLLPLASGNFGLFSEASEGISYFICNELEYKLLHQVSDSIIDRNIPSDLFSRLSAIAKFSNANIALFNVQCFLQIFSIFFPSSWKYNDGIVWNPNSNADHPTTSWFMLFWQYLREQCDELSRFGEWPILPSISGHLYRPSKFSKLINTELLSDKMNTVLAKIGCKILNPNYGVEHRELSLYVYNSDAAGVLDAIFDVVSSDENFLQTLFQNIVVDEKNELRQFLLDPKWYVGGHLSESHIQHCKYLPIYKVYDGGYIHPFHFSNLETPKKYLPPLDAPEYFLGDEFICSSSNDEDDILLRYYAIERMGKSCFYKKNVLNRIPELQPEVRDTVMLSILQDLPQLCVEDASLRESLRKLEFVPTLSGTLKCPQVLYDPRNEELYALLEDSDLFPCGSFQEPGVLDMLQGLGLRSWVSPETVIQSARQIESIMHTSPSKAYSRGKVLLSYLEVNATKWLSSISNDGQRTMNRMFSKVATAFRSRGTSLESDLETFWNDLRMICWCPVLVAAPYTSLPWPSVSSVVAPPKLVRLQADLWLVSASMRILDGDCSSTALSGSLGWSSPPGGGVIAAQLLELGKNSELVTDQVLRQELALAMPRIYSLLTGMIGLDEMEIVKAVLEGSRWIWVGDGFATSDEVVINGPLHLAPYIRVIPVDLAVFRELFLGLGICEFLKPTDYINILCKMAGKKDCTPLDAQELRAAVLIVQHLAEVHFQDQQVKIYLPDVSSRLFPAADLVYNDAPWLLNIGDNTFGSTSTISLSAKRNAHKFVHGNISNDVAEKLGVCSLRRLLLAESADSMNLSLSGVAEAFGQHEALTTRLKHIVEMYADGPGILFELVQNADDAGASEVVFLLDKTQYGTSSVLSPEMADWQGPALYCFNNSVFSPQDLYAISRIGQDSKLEKPFTIGRFGLGFNCVYHFTDIPGFVSGENIVMFDPHACNLPGISPTHPGLRIRFVGRRILEQFPDQFVPFLQFGCDLQNPFPGTLFRFPLRTENAASRSQIKKESYAPDDVLSLFSSFSEVVSEALLFLRNVKTISIFVKGGAGQDMELLHRIDKQNISEAENEPHPLHTMLKFIHGDQHSGLDNDQFFSKLSKTMDRDLPWNCQKIVVKELNSCGEKSHFWMTSECLGGGRARSKSVSVDNRSRNFIPWACVAAYLHSIDVKDVKTLNNNSPTTEEEDGSSIQDHFLISSDSIQHRREFEGRAFSFLPLPISTGLPTHVNAYFELSSNRRDIWFGNDMAGGGKVRSDWNIYLLEDVVAPAYGHLLAKVAAEIGSCDLFFSFWPTTTGVEPWASMVRKLYVCISDLGLRVLYTKARGGQWISTKQAVFPDFTFPRSNELAEALSEAGLPLVVISKPIVERFVEACPSLHFLTPQLLRTLLIRRKREFKNKDAMILTLEYCLSDITGSVPCDTLHGLPLVPLASGLFTTFRKRGEGERIFVTGQNEYGLLNGSVPYNLVDCTIPEEIVRKLRDIAQSGDSNISLLTCHSLEDLFTKILPGEWQHAKQVSWTPGHQGQPSLEWMGLLWNYLKSSCVDLSIFSKWPILPVSNGCLLQLVKNSNVIRDDGWSENMSSLLQKFGCFFLRPDLPIDHPQLNNFVQDSTATGILNSLFAITGKAQNIEDLFVDASEGEVHELRSFIFQSKWFYGDQMDSRHIDMIKLLPIFDSYKTRKLISLSGPTKWLKPVGVHEELLDENFVRTESEREKTILRIYLGIREPSRTEFYKDHVLNRISEFLLQPLVLSAILLDVKLLIEEDSSLKSVLSQTPFVLAADGSWKYPSRLYDPHIPGLQKLLHKEAFFPCDKFLNTETLEILVSLGLKRTLGFAGLLDSARSVSMLHDSGHAEALSYGRRLLVCLDSLGLKLTNGDGEESGSKISDPNSHPKNGELCEDPEVIYPTRSVEENSCEWDLEIESCLGIAIHDKPEEEFWSEMRSIDWCPVCVDPPLKGLPWLISTHRVAPPSIVRPKSLLWMVSSMMRMLDGECRSQYLQCKLGWLDQPSISVLSTQLVELSKSYCQLKLQSEQEPLLDDALQKEIPTLYSKLQEFVDTDDFMILKSAVDGVSWVWIGDNFVSPKALAFDSPVKFHPYLYVVPSELSEFRVLLTNLGVRLTFDAVDYIHVLQRLQHDLKGLPLSSEQLSFVHCVLEVVADFSGDNSLSDTYMGSLLIPDSNGVLMCAMDLVYNDAPWMEKNNLGAKHFVHPSIHNDLANRLGVQSVRCLSLVDEELMKDLPCMDYTKIRELLALYGDEFLLFDLLELADCCKARKLHLIFDKREHPQQSLLQHNLGEFQGPALTAVLEGATLSREEICNLQLRPPWRLRGTTLNYGLGLLSCYSISHLPSVVSSGFFYIFDPLGLALAAPSSHTPSAKIFSLIGTNLTERFRDQFHPMLIRQNVSLSSSDSTVIRMPLSSERKTEGSESSCKKVKQMFNRFIENGSTTLLFLKSVLQVSLSTWEEGSLHPTQDYSVCVDPSSIVMRNPFSEKKWRKFQISRLFSSSSAVIKLHTIDMHVFQEGTKVIDKWLVVLSLGSGQTRNMALDRRYLAYNLTPVAGVAAHISRNGEPACAHSSSCILSPLPLSGDISIPVSALGYFLVCHNSGRYLFKRQNSMTTLELQPDVGNQLMEAWNKELMSCVRDSYVEMVLEFQKLRRDPLTSSIETNSARAVSLVLLAYGDRVYSLWPRSKQHSLSSNQPDPVDNETGPLKVVGADWQCLVEQVIRPFYARLVDLPVWQLYCGNTVKVEEGMFLSKSGNEGGINFPPATVCSFIKEHYPVFSVPWELVSEIQAVGITVREIKPKMVRDLLKASSTSVVLRSVETYIDVLEYCLGDIYASRGLVSLTSLNEMHVAVDNNIPGNREPFASNLNTQRSNRVLTQSPDALEMMTSIGSNLLSTVLHNVRGAVEDFGWAPGSSIQSNLTGGSGSDADMELQSIVAALKGLPCPTATKHLTRLGVTELWVGSKDHQLLMVPLAARFLHPECLERQVLADFFSNQSIHRFLKLRNFSPSLLSSHMRQLFSEHWTRHIMGSNKAPWVSWEHRTDSTNGGPSAEWIRLFWRSFSGSSEDLLLFSDWPLIPAFLGRPVLCRVKEHNLVFIPPITEPTLENGDSMVGDEGTETALSGDHLVKSELMKYFTAFENIKARYPWLLSLLNQCNIPSYDMSFLDAGVPCTCLPTAGQSLGQVIVSKLLAAKCAGYFCEPSSFLEADRDELFTLFASDFTSSRDSTYKREELDVLRALPIYKTVLGTYTRLHSQDHCIISPTAFFHPNDERVLSNSIDSSGSLLLRALGVPELHDQEILVKFGLPGFGRKSQGIQEVILMYLCTNWQDLQLDSTVISVLKETNFVRNANELCVELFKPKNLLDPCDPLLSSVFSGERDKFPGERFNTEGWLHILRKIGLRTASESDMIVECAKKVELLGNQAMKCTEDPDDFEAEFSGVQTEISLEIWSLAESVVEAIFSNFAVLYGNNFCNILSGIAFVPAEKGFPSIGGKKGGKRVLTSYSEAIILQDWPLAWSSVPILARPNIVPPEYSWGAFHLRSPPTFATVLKHLQVIGRNSGEDTLAHWPTSSGMMTIEEASCEVLKYLDKTRPSLSASDTSELQKVAFIPVANGTRLVTANSLFVHLTVNLSPFAFELPTLYLPFVKILKDIGLQDVLSVACAKDLLLNIQRSCGYQRLNPNELRAVMEVLHFIYDDVQAKSDGSDWVTDAIVPDDGCRLVLGRSCVYLDAQGSRLIRNIDTFRLRFVHPDLPEKICTALGIKKLSEMVLEELDNEQQFDPLDHIGSVSLEMIKDRLLSRSLQVSVWTVYNSVYVPAFEVPTFDQIQRSLQSMAEKIQFVRCLHTRFLLLPNSLDITRITKKSSIPEWDGGSGHRTLYFIDRSRTHHVLVAEPPSYISVFDVIAIIVSQVLGSPTVLPVASLFSSPEGSEREILDVLKLGSDRAETGRSERLIGKELLPQDALQVQFHPLRPFYKGEVVAWKIGKDGEKLKYGSVPEDVRPSAGQALYRFTVETAPGKTEPLLSSQVFSFKSMSSENSTSPLKLPDNSQTNVNRKHNKMIQHGGGSSKTGSYQTGKELQYGRVSTEELVEAVREMLSAAGINMDAEKQTLLQATLTLQEQLKESQAALLLEQEKADAASKEADAAKAAWSCRICLSAEVDITIVPCGHVLCRRCSSSVSRCPFCRLHVSKTMKIFRP